MGIVRTLLALSVVCAHMDGFRFFDAQYAVQCFYVISGFLISLILTEQGAYRSTRNFYFARYLRLFPVYIVVAVISLIVLVVTGDPQFWGVYGEGTPLWTKVWLGVSNVVLFGQAQVLFFAQQGGEIVYPLSYAFSENVLWRGLVNPPAWTLEIELLFYLVAPFVLRRKILLFALLGASIFVRLYLWHLDLIWTDPWTYRFFPSELALFLVGALAHQYILPLYQKIGKDLLDRLSWGAVALTILVLFGYEDLRDGLGYGVVVTGFVLFVLLVPLLFHFQNNSDFDKRVGDLSYPVYICHWVVVNGVMVSLGRDVFANPLTQIVGVTVVIGFAWLLDRCVATPVDHVRRRFRTHV